MFYDYFFKATDSHNQIGPVFFPMPSWELGLELEVEVCFTLGF